MREESHLEDMRAAIRGDFDRLAERRGEQELMVEATDREPTATSATDPVPKSAGPSLQQNIASEQEDDHPRRSWLSRLLSS